MRDKEKENLISKKELLESTGISYGQFYRWKRKGLIPDNWLIRKSTRTGQESFLPANKIIPRIEQIKELKETTTLSEIADLLSPELVEKKYKRTRVKDLDLFNERLMESYEEIAGKKDLYSFHDLVHLMVLLELKGVERIGESTFLAIRALESIEEGSCELDQKVILAEKRRAKDQPATDSGFCLVATGEVNFDPTVEVIMELNLPELVRELKLELRDLGGLVQEG